MDRLSKLKQYNIASLYLDGLIEEDVQFFLDCLSDERPHIVQGAAFLLTGLKREQIVQVFPVFHHLSRRNQKTVVANLVTVHYVEIYLFLLSILEDSDDDDLCSFITYSMSKSDYLIFPLLIPRLNTDNLIYKKRLRGLINKMGFGKVAVYLAAYPIIPHEAFFRGIFGDKRIDSILN